jgi:hypothetical protein
MTDAIARPIRTPIGRVAAASGQLVLPLRPPVVASCVARRPRRPQRERPASCLQAVQLVIAFPAKPRRYRPVNPHAAANALALLHRDIAATVAGNISRRTGHPKEDLEQIAMLGIIQAARRYSPERGSFRPYARTYANGEVYHFLRDKGFLIKVPSSWRELYARGMRMQRTGNSIDEVLVLLNITHEKWLTISCACAQRVVPMQEKSQYDYVGDRS